ncbi:hypothetical protein [Paenibacillus elgii]|uniref:hypothetical protein n=1 Tax=Paenibacillus elgii TaxID=189691 RepID=UPI000FDBE66F|nr:hypothetical protein [Paenibacillus elgii]NEN82397.1 hypothetical protein [Paenibacillus elgii]
MVWRLLLCLLLLVLPACNAKTDPLKTENTIIDWVDFVKLNGKEYSGVYEAAAASLDAVTDEVVGIVKFRVEGAVTNPGYATKDGDAAFLQEGTRLYAVKGYPDHSLIAAKADNEVGGYKLYSARNADGNLAHTWSYKDLPAERVTRIDVYVYSKQAGAWQRFRSLERADTGLFMELLGHGQKKENYWPAMTGGDPKEYRIVFQTGEPVAHKQSLFRDDNYYYFHPSDTEVLPEEIGRFLTTRMPQS